MTMTVFGLLDRSRDAQAVIDDLAQGGCDRTQIEVLRPPTGDRSQGAPDTLAGAFRDLYAMGPKDQIEVLAQGVRRGGTLVAVHGVSKDAAESVVRILESHGALDIDQHDD